MHADHDILEHSQVREQADILEGAGYAALQYRMRAQSADLSAGEANTAATGWNYPGDHVEQCRFARTVGPDHGNHRLGADAQFD